MRKSIGLAATATIIAVGLGTTATAASAYSISPPNTAFTATNTGAHTFSTSGLTWSCHTVTSTGTTGAAGTPLRFRPTYSGCTLTMAGTTFPATVAVASDWEIAVTGGTGPWSGTVKVLPPASGNAITVSVPTLGCAIFFNAQTLTSGISMTNTTPTGVKITANVPNIAYTQNMACNIPATGAFTYAGVADIPGITISN